jgi:hypothetical protein
VLEIYPPATDPPGLFGERADASSENFHAQDKRDTQTSI